MDMNSNPLVIRSVLESLESWDDYRSPAATEQQLARFTGEAKGRRVPDAIIGQLVALYSTCNGVSYETVMAFHCCSNPIIFEWWATSGDLWLGQKDFYTLRWNNRTDTFSLGDPSNLSFGEAYESPTLIGLIDICVAEIRSE